MKHMLMVFALAFGLSLHCHAQNTDVLLVARMNDGQEITHEMTSTSRLSFEDNTYLVIEDNGILVAKYALADIQKITCSEVEGLSDAEEDALSVYPNPVHDIMVLRHLEGTQMVSIYAVDGRLMRSMEVGSGQGIDVSDFPAGLYLVKTQQQTLKMIKL